MARALGVWTKGLGGAVSGRGLVAVMVWGASFVATRVALGALNPFGLVAIRLLAGTLLLGMAVWVRGGRPLPVRRDVPAVIFLGLVLCAHLLIQAHGLQRTSAINTGWLVGFMPVTIALGAYLLGQQRLARLGWLGVAIGTGGVLIVTMKAPPNFARARFGDLLQMVSCLTWTVYTLAGAGPVARNGALRVTTLSMGVAALVATIATIWTGLPSGALTGESLLAMAFLGPVCSGVAYYLWYAALDAHGPTRVGSLLYLEPFVSLATGSILLHEPVTGNALLGGLCVLVGVWMVAKGARKTAAATVRVGT